MTHTNVTVGDVPGCELRDHGVTRYFHVVEAFHQRRNPDTMAHETIVLIVPNVGRLTDARRLAIGRRLWEICYGDTVGFDAADLDQIEHWLRGHMGKHPHMDVAYNTDWDVWDYATPSSGGSVQHARFNLEQI